MKKYALAARFAVTLALGLASAPPVLAHGRLPELNDILFDPTDPNHVVARATWGMMVSFDGGATWDWRCSEAVPFDRFSENPAMVLNTAGELVVAGYRNNVRVGDEMACEWRANAMPPPQGFMVDIEAHPTKPDELLLLSSPLTGNGDELQISTDGGASWSVRSTLPAGFVTYQVAFAPSSPQTIYVAGTFYDPVLAGGVFRSNDGGLTWPVRVDIPLVGEEGDSKGEVGFELLAVDPSDRERIFARAVRENTDLIPERILLIEGDALQTTPVLEALEVVGFTMSADGMHAWAGSWDGGFYRSDDGGASFQKLSDERIRCLDWRAGASGSADQLWVCADNLLGGTYALGRSTDNGATIVPLWRFSDLREATGCGFATAVGMSCPALWYELAFDTGVLQSDGGVPVLDGGDGDAGSATTNGDAGAASADAGSAMIDSGRVDAVPPSSGGCSCAIGRKSVNGWAVAFGLLGLIIARRRHRR